MQKNRLARQPVMHTVAVSMAVCGALLGGNPGCGSPETGTDATSVTDHVASGDESSSVVTGDPGGTDAVTTSGAAPTTGESVTTGSADATGSMGDPSCGFICDTTDGSLDPYQCDTFAQDCPEGHKCAPYAEGGGSWWNATKCVPITGAGKPGDVCEAVGGGITGLDDCREGAMCWDIDEMMMGTCVEMCGGSPGAPTCLSGSCATSGDGTLNLCLPDCDPLAQDCAQGHVCIPSSDPGRFECVLDASKGGGAAYSPCEFANSCQAGSFCNDPVLAPNNCDANASGCCIPFCDLDMPPSCPGVDTSCVPYYEEGTAPSGKENLGACLEVR